MSQQTSRLVLLTGDTTALVLSGLLGLWLRFDGAPPPALITNWLRHMVVAVPMYVVIYYYFGLYRRLWRYATAVDLIDIATTVGFATVLLFGLIYINPDHIIPRSIPVMSWFFNVAAAGGMRFAVRLRREKTQRSARASQQTTLVLGAGEAARILVSEIAKHHELDYRLLGFLDDDKHKQGLEIAGLPVLGPLSMLETVVENQSVAQIIIAMPSAPYATTRVLVQRCTALGIKAQIMPGLYGILRDGITVPSIRDVRIEDLLGRPQAILDCDSISGYLRGKTVLVTGAGGSIGSELARQIAGFAPANLLLLGRGENSIYDIHRELAREHPHIPYIPLIADIQDETRMEYVFANYKPAVVFHAAAHKHVPLMEVNPTEALKNNVLGTKVVAEASARHGVDRFVLVSTDKAVNPTSVMGTTKRIAELLVLNLNEIPSGSFRNGTSMTKFMAVRFGNVLGSRGSVVPLFKEQIARGGPVTVTHPEMTRYFMTIPEAVGLIIQAGAMGNGGEVFVLDMGAPVKILDLARDLIALSGLKPGEDIEIAISGLRPGEKLFEELITAKDSVAATAHKQIMIVRPTTPAHTDWGAYVEQLTALCHGCEGHEVLALLRPETARAVAEAAAGEGDDSCA